MIRRMTDDEFEQACASVDCISKTEARRARAREAAMGEALEAASGILWMARNYAEAGGSGGPEMRDFAEAEAKIRAALSNP